MKTRFPVLGRTLLAIAAFTFTAASAEIEILPIDEIEALDIQYQTIPLSSVANRNFVDEKAGDGVGGWTDQGANSLTGLRTGRRLFDGIPFLISGEDGAQCIVLRGQGAESYPTRVEIPIDAEGNAVYFLHADAYGSPRVGTYTVRYEDGSEEIIPIRNNVEIFDWWSPTTSRAMRVGWVGDNPEHTPIGLALFAWENPHPDKRIGQIVAETPGDQSFLMIAGITVSPSGPYLSRIVPKERDTSDWFAYKGVDVEKKRNTALDVSFLLDAPAGNHGWLEVHGEDFVFEDGTKVKFWGVNIVASANFPSHEDAERMAEMLAQMGVNMTRHHHGDAPWAVPNFFGNAEGTRSLDPEAMDRFDYLIAELQKRGIYQYMDLLVHREPLAEDGIRNPEDIENGYKIEGEFAPTLIYLQKEFIRNFLGHRNPYTRKTYGEDPGFALMEIINEDSLFYRRSSGTWATQTAYYRDRWNSLYNTWLLENLGTRQDLAERWAPAEGEDDLIALEEDEDPQLGTVVSIENWEGGDFKKYSRQRQLDNFRFYYDMQLDYFHTIEGVVRKMGSKAPITGSNHWVSLPIDLYANAQLDYIDRHDYWAHPSGGYGYGPDVSFTPGSMTRQRNGGLVGGLAPRRVKGYPYIVTEWQASAPNDYRQEGMLIMSAYCAFQNWSATQFAFSHTNSFDDALTSNFDIYNQPGMLAVWPASSLIVLRGDVAESTLAYFYPLTTEELFSPETRTSHPAGLPMIAKTGIEFIETGGEKPDLSAVVQRHTRGGIMTAVSGELKFDPKGGVLAVNAPRSQGFTGFTQGRTLKTSNLNATLDNDYALVLVSALEAKPITLSQRILITAAGNAINTGMRFSDAGNRVEEVGSAPVLVEPIVGTITLLDLEGGLSTARVYALDPSGQRKHDVPVEADGRTLTFDMKPEYEAMHYELVR